MNNNQRRADTAPYWNSAVEVTGPRRSDHRTASDTRNTSELISAYLRTSDDSEAADLITTIQYRGGAEEFRAGLALLTSKDSRERAAGAEILGQLGWQDRTFLEESVNALLGALIDADDHVLQSVIFAGIRGSDEGDSAKCRALSRSGPRPDSTLHDPTERAEARALIAGSGPRIARAGCGAKSLKTLSKSAGPMNGL